MFGLLRGLTARGRGISLLRIAGNSRVEQRGIVKEDLGLKISRPAVPRNTIEMWASWRLLTLRGNGPHLTHFLSV